MLAQVPWGIPAVVSDLRQKHSWGHNVLNPMVRSSGAHQSETSASSTAKADQNLIAAQSQRLGHPQYSPLCWATSEEHLAVSGNITAAADSVVCVS